MRYFFSFSTLDRHIHAFFVILVLLDLAGSAQGRLRIGFYSNTCPNAESIVLSVVKRSVQLNPRNVPILLRLHFHDCFVEGCDGSILIDRGSERDERRAFGHQGVEGYEVVEEAKVELEKVCPGVVSCADIVALMARDAVTLGRGPPYDVPTGRRDGRVSNVDLAGDMPEAGDSIEVLKLRFKKKGLSDQDLVLLSAAHSIGTTACFFMQDRLYNFNNNNNNSNSDPAIDPQFLTKLKSQCPPGSNGERISLDPITETVIDDQIFRNIKSGFAVIASDARLYDDMITRQITDTYIGNSTFSQDFASAMVRMGRIGLKNVSQGEIRRVCSKFNSI